MKRTIFLVASLATVLAVFSLATAAEFAPAEQSELGKSVKDIPVASHWIYDDLAKAKAQAKETGKPLLVVLRCVPCPPGKALDEKVMQPDKELEAIEKQFVCVRIIQTKGLDLGIFQYDYDMSWAAMFLAPDLTIYGRYGTRNASGPGSDSLLSAAAFKKAAELALELHKGYPANKETLAAKKGKTPDYSVPEKTPGLEERGQGETTRQKCIHCHMVKEFALRAKWEAGKLSPADLWVYPMPQQIGLTLDLDDGLLVKSVARGSPAHKAGLDVGDELVTAAGQPLISTADFQWVLQTSPADANLRVTIRRDGGRILTANIALRGDWKEQSDIAWRASSWYGLRQGLKVEPLSAADKKNRGIEPDNLALAVKGLFGKGAPKLQAAGLRNGDVIVAVDGKSEGMTESAFLANLRLAHGPKDSVRFTILRGEKTEELTIPMW
jgi:serine protease Do